MFDDSCIYGFIDGVLAGVGRIGGLEWVSFILEGGYNLVWVFVVMWYVGLVFYYKRFYIFKRNREFEVLYKIF